MNKKAIALIILVAILSGKIKTVPYPGLDSEKILEPNKWSKSIDYLFFSIKNNKPNNICFAQPQGIQKLGSSQSQMIPQSTDDVAQKLIGHSYDTIRNYMVMHPEEVGNLVMSHKKELATVQILNDFDCRIRQLPSNFLKWIPSKAQLHMRCVKNNQQDLNQIFKDGLTETPSLIHSSEKNIYDFIIYPESSNELKGLIVSKNQTDTEINIRSSWFSIFFK